MLKNKRLFTIFLIAYLFIIIIPFGYFNIITTNFRISCPDCSYARDALYIFDFAVLPFLILGAIIHLSFYISSTLKKLALIISCIVAIILTGAYIFNIWHAAHYRDGLAVMGTIAVLAVFSFAFMVTFILTIIIQFLKYKILKGADPDNT